MNWVLEAERIRCSANRLREQRVGRSNHPGVIDVFPLSFFRASKAFQF